MLRAARPAQRYRPAGPLRVESYRFHFHRANLPPPPHGGTSGQQSGRSLALEFGAAGALAGLALPLGRALVGPGHLPADFPPPPAQSTRVSERVADCASSLVGGGAATFLAARATFAKPRVADALLARPEDIAKTLRWAGGRAGVRGLVYFQTMSLLGQVASCAVDLRDVARDNGAPWGGALLGLMVVGPTLVMAMSLPLVPGAYAAGLGAGQLLGARAYQASASSGASWAQVIMPGPCVERALPHGTHVI